MDAARTMTFVDRFWDEAILPTLAEYITIPNQSVAFDADWEANGHMDRAVELARSWVEGQALPGATLEVWRIPGRTPVLFVEVPGQIRGTVLLYGHLDKQPPMTGWEPDLDPWKPVFRGDKLYGRGGADDGYAVFASVAAAKAFHDQGLAHPRLVFVIECSEESGSCDLPSYIEAYADRIGTPGLVVCLDSGCGDYDRLWLTTSLRGMVIGTLRVDILREGVHSGRASGIVPSSFRIAREVLSRIEDPATGAIVGADLHVDIPEERVIQARQAAAVLHGQTAAEMPFVDGARAVSDDPVELLLNRTWRPALAVTGQDGLPSVAHGGNVLRPHTALKLSLRLPPTQDPVEACARVKALLEADPPYGAQVTFHEETPNPGWHAPPLATWLEVAVDEASKATFGPGAAYVGEGGSIPFMGMLCERFPEAQFVITGLLGPQSNAHGPNEFLHIPTGKRVTAAVANIIDAYGAHLGETDG